MELSRQAAGIGALADPTRRTLYEYVSNQAGPVGREQTANALGIAVHNVSFHLDRLVSEGLLEVEYRRLTGKSGPGAGRPSKLYRRADREFAISLPPRRYDLVGDILAAAVTRASAGDELDQALHESARTKGVALGAADKHDSASLSDLADVLAAQGYEPKVDDEIVLSNCPFDDLAAHHTALVCGLNQSYVQGVADGIGCRDVEAHLEPKPGRCCVTLRPRGSTPRTSDAEESKPS